MPTEGHGPSGIYLIILTDGVIVWDTAAQDFDWEITTAIPSCLKGVFPSEPLYADFRPARSSRTYLDSDKEGVTSADRKSFGEVFGYLNLYVADGAIVPTAVGANPTATISALSEIVAEGVTGLTPSADL